jgi:predicted nucleotidyltransferase
MTIPAGDLPGVLGATMAAVSEVLTGLGVTHALIGGLAVGVHSEARATKDIDFAASADTVAAHRVVEQMAVRGFSAHTHGTLGPGSVVRFVQTGEDGLERWVDVLFAGTPFEERAIARATPVHVLGHAVPVVSVEDLLVYKLLASRPRDIADAARLLADHDGALDREYLRSALAEWDLVSALDRLERARDTE